MLKEQNYPVEMRSSFAVPTNAHPEATSKLAPHLRPPREKLGHSK